MVRRRDQAEADMSMTDEQRNLSHSEAEENAEIRGDAEPEDGRITIPARKARGAGLGIENRRDGLRLAGAAAFALVAIVLAAVVTSVTA